MSVIITKELVEEKKQWKSLKISKVNLKSSNHLNKIAKKPKRKE